MKFPNGSIKAGLWINGFFYS